MTEEDSASLDKDSKPAFSESEEQKKIPKKKKETPKRGFETVSPEDFANDESQYLDFPIGSELEFELKEIRKVVDSKGYNLSGRDYKYELVSSEGKLLSVNAWAFYNALKQAEISFGDVLHVVHSGSGKYSVKKVDASKSEQEGE